MKVTTRRPAGSSAAALGASPSLLVLVAIIFAVSLLLHHSYSASAFVVVLVPANRNVVEVGSFRRFFSTSTRKTSNHPDPWSFTKRYASIVDEQQQQQERHDDALTTDKKDSDHDNDSSSSTNFSAGAALKQEVLQLFHSEDLQQEANEYANMFGLGTAEGTLFRLFAALRRTKQPLGLKSAPFSLRHQEMVVGEDEQDTTSGLAGFFTMKDLEKAVEDDFLDAARGSTDNRKGWQVS